MQQPKVSIIVPVYNTEKYLRKCLDSLVLQTLEEIEIVAVDDGSTDRSGEILDEYLEKYPQKMTVVHKENGGQGIARNIGITMCQGEYIGFMDSDDYVELTMYQTLYETAVANNADFVECQYRYVRSENNQEIELSTYGNVREYETVKEMFVNPLVSPWNKMYKKELLLESGSWFTEGVIYEDTAFFIKQIPYIKKMTYIDIPFVTHILRGSSTMSVNKSKRVGDIFVVLKDIISFYNEQDFQKQYEKELEYFCVKILLCSSLERVSKVKDKLLKKKFLSETNRIIAVFFDDYKKNPYMNKGWKNCYMKMVSPKNIRLFCWALGFVSKV